MAVDFDNVLKYMMDKGGSDLHLKVGLKPLMRLSGDLEPQSEFDEVTEEDMNLMFNKVLENHQKEIFKKNHEVDTSYELKGLARFRGNIFLQQRKMGGVFRIIPNKIPTLEVMGYPEVLKDFTEYEQGLVLVTGPTGSGKSTTLAAMINHINMNSKVHIVTIEDPLEFVHRDQMAVLNQREVGFDTLSFSNALRAAMRQDPDIVLVGEMRDAETIQIAMSAAETGHLVFSTLHTVDAKQTIDRIIDTFDPKQQNQVRMQLANVLRAVISQRLVPRADKAGRVAAMEIMINSPMIRKLIEENKIGAIQKAMDDSAAFYGMQTFNHHLFKLVKEGGILEETALATSQNPADLRIKLQTSSFVEKAPAPQPEPEPPAPSPEPPQPEKEPPGPKGIFGPKKWF